MENKGIRKACILDSHDRSDSYLRAVEYGAESLKSVMDAAILGSLHEEGVQ